MLILTVRTDKPEAEIGLFEGATKLGYETWLAHRELAETLHRKIQELLEASGKTWSDLKGVVGYRGPGSFTGLRIGLTVANTIAQANRVPVVAAQGDAWLTTGLGRIMAGENDKAALPEYGAPVRITVQKK